MAEGETTGERMPRPRRHRRVTTPPSPGSDPTPALPPRLRPAGSDGAEGGDAGGFGERGIRGARDDSNDERLRRDVPPHW